MQISIALPVYNGLPYLSDAIATILSQEGEFELIISDDKSSDGSAELVQSLSDPRIRILTNEKNLGIFGNLNRCVEAAKGEFIQVFSQDDLMKPGYLLSQVRRLQSDPDVGLVYGAADCVDEKSVVTGLTLVDHTPELIDLKLYLWIASHYGALPASISSVMVPRGTFDKIGLFDTRYRVAGDIEFYNRVAEHFKVARNPEILHSVRSHPRMTSALSSAGPLYLQEEIALQPWYRRHWSPSDYRKIQRFRSATRGRYHLGWIRRRILGGSFGEAGKALLQLGKVYPLRWVFWSVLIGLFRPDRKPKPVLAPPER
jgi:glycosyltransferase involved in cell wall biosynthesis